MRLTVHTEILPAVLAAAAMSATALLGSFTYVVVQATERGVERRLQASKAIMKAGPTATTARASP